MVFLKFSAGRRGRRYKLGGRFGQMYNIKSKTNIVLTNILYLYFYRILTIINNIWFIQLSV